MSSSVVFLGTSAFAVPSLKALAANDRFDVRLVITQPDRPVGRKQIITPSPVKIAALELGLPIEQPEKLNAEVKSSKLPFEALRPSGPNGKVESPDFLVVVSYGQILSEEVLKWPKIAAINVHASLLPVLRGASPIQHAILQGMPETGVTIQRMAKELDAGPMLSRESIPLDERETFESLHEKLATLGANLLIRTLTLPLKEQEQDHTKATFCKKLKTADGIADPQTMTAEQIDRMVRALGKEPGVGWNEAKILEASLSSDTDSFPLPCKGQSLLFVSRIQPNGGKPMSGKEYAQGHDIPSPTV